MLRLLLGAAIVLMAVAAHLACSPPTGVGPGSDDPGEAAREAIRAVSDAEFKAVKEGDIDAHLAVLGDDAVILPPNEAAIHGKPAFRASSETFYSQFTMERFDHSREELVVAGDWAFERWTVSMAVASREGGDAVSDQVKGIHIYRKQSDGNWKIVRDIWNSDNPVPGLPGQ